MSTSGAWKYRPNSASLKGVVNTCLGPIRTEIYAEGLKTLCSNTRDNLDRLKAQISKLDPCLEYGIEHWHPERRPSSAPPHWVEREKTNGRWEDTNVMFTSVDIIESLKDAPNDDSDSYIGAPVPVNKFCYLCSSMDEHERHLILHRSKRKVKSSKPKIEFIAPKPKIKKKKDPENVLVKERLYRVDVFTGDLPNAGTSANVFITIKGSLELLPKTKLVKKRGSSNFCFVRASKETFHIKGPNLGNLQMLTIEHDGEEKKHAWYLDKVEITDVKALKTWVFNCQNWISIFEKPHYSNSVDLTAQISTKTLIDYMVEVITGNKQLAGTDAQIFLTIFGTEGVSKKIHLIDKTRGLKCFERGRVDHFEFKMFDLGELKKIRIEQDGSGFAPGWNLDRVIINSVDKPKEKYYFVYRGWISKDVGDGRLWREIKGTKTIPKLVEYAGSRGNKIKYEVTVKTGDVKFAGTDANVFIRFCGSAGLTDKLKLDNSKNNFERDMTDEFVLHAENVGPLTKIVIGHDNFGPGAGWFLDHVEVRRHLPRDEVIQRVRVAKKKLKEKQKKIKEKKEDKLDDIDKKLSKLAVRNKNRKSERGYDDSDENDEGGNNKKDRKLKHDERSLLSGSRRSLARTLSHISEEEEEEDEDEEELESDDDKSDEYSRKHWQQLRRPNSGRGRQQVASKRSDDSDDEDDSYKKRIKSKDGRKTPPEQRKFRSRSASAIKLEKEAEEDDNDAGTKVRVPLYEVYIFPCHRWLAKDEEDGLTVRELEVEKKTTYYRD
ncbi:hypothetical protein CHS0354_008713 [Potamilus streckersoni]|uniref:PLAT domain-containing protein n=1 Tax=Potamilus streckersoni TaxID=2493646 RepID=A0AAE0VSJ5_9BIVA|nr:hypothetical protein CHS0354_008713 [Potamilus streckersoni]